MFLKNRKSNGRFLVSHDASLCQGHNFRNAHLQRARYLRKLGCLVSVFAANISYVISSVSMTRLPDGNLNIRNVCNGLCCEEAGETVAFEKKCVPSISWCHQTRALLALCASARSRVRVRHNANRNGLGMFVQHHLGMVYAARPTYRDH